MKKRRLVEAVQQLRKKLETADSVEGPARESLLSVLNEIEAITESSDEISARQHQSLLDRLRTSAGHFEESHLSLTLAAGRVIDVLSSMGI